MIFLRFCYTKDSETFTILNSPEGPSSGNKKYEHKLESKTVYNLKPITQIIVIQSKLYDCMNENSITIWPVISIISIETYQFNYN